MAEEEKKDVVTEEKGEATSEEKTKKKEAVIEIITVIMLGITALLTAWASYVGSIHGGNQATNYAKSNNLSAEGNSMYNEAAQNIMQDMQLWNQISELQVEIMYADSIDDEDALEEATYKMLFIVNDSIPEAMAEHIGWTYEFEDSSDILAWLDQEEAMTSPFFDEEYVNSYYDDALSVLAESEEVIAQGQEDNNNGDKFTLVTVIFSVVLFLLGIVGVFKIPRNKTIVLVISMVAFVAALVFMLTIPLPVSGGIFG